MSSLEAQKDHRACPERIVLHARNMAASAPPPRHVSACPGCAARWQRATSLSQFLLAEAATLFPTRCPDEAQWAAALDGTLPTELHAHLDRCERCSDLWTFLRRGRSVTVCEARTGWRIRRWAAVASLAIGLLLWIRPWSPVESPSEMIVRGEATRLRASMTRQADGDVVLRWSRAAVADGYRLRTWSLDGRSILDERRSGTSKVLDAGTLERWSSTLLWQVEALEAGREIGGTSVQRIPAGQRVSTPDSKR